VALATGPLYMETTMYRVLSILSILALLLLLAISLSGQDVITWVTLPDVSGSGKAVALSSSSSMVRLCQLQAPSTNTSDVQWGDSNISTSRGSAIPPGAGQFVPPVGSSYSTGGALKFDLSKTYVLVQTGDKLRATCAK
jgi:hypothetical protein